MDLKIAIFLNQLWENTFVDLFTELISNTSLLFIFGVCLVLFSLIIDKKNGKTVLFSVLFAATFHLLITEGFFKNLLSLITELRLRPYIAYPEIINQLGTKYIDSSFPSSHMSSITAFLTIILFFYRKTIILGVIFIILMAFARIHNGAHYPTDVLAGIILGISYGILSIYLSKKLLKIKNN